MFKRGTRIIFVGNLNFKTNEEDLEKIFKEFGTIEQITLPRQDENGNKGFAYITFSSPEEAEAALRKDESTVDGKIITVEFYRRKQRFRGFSDRRSYEEPSKSKGKHHHHHHHHHRESSDDYDSLKSKRKRKHHHHHKKDKKHRHHKKTNEYSSDYEQSS